MTPAKRKGRWCCILHAGRDGAVLEQPEPGAGVDNIDYLRISFPGPPKPAKVIQMRKQR